MSDRDALLAAVLADPDDDAPRLVFADWLDENGESARAEFIRLQVARDRLPPRTARWRALDDRAHRLQKPWRDAWAGDTLARVLAVEFRRGFVDHAAVTVEQFLAGADEVLRTEPVRFWEFRPVNFFRSGAGLSGLAGHPAFGRVRGLACGYALADELFAELAGVGPLDGLRAVMLSGRCPGPKAVAALFDAAPRLVDLDAEDIPYSHVSELWRRGAAPRLRRLGLVRCRLTDRAVERLADSPAVGRLEALRLDGNDLSDRAAEALAASDHLGRLRELSLAGVPIGDSGAIALARSPALRELRVLNLSGCYLDGAGAQGLADSPYLDRLECLCLDENRVSVEVERELARRFGPDVCSFAWAAGV